MHLWLQIARKLRGSLTYPSHNLLEDIMIVKNLSLYTFAALITTVGAALACGPAPSCWMESGPTYLKSVCSGYAKHPFQKSPCE